MRNPTLDTSHIDTDADGPDDDSSDVVTGPIGSARLVEPAKAESLGADLEALPTIDAGDGSSD